MADQQPTHGPVTSTHQPAARLSAHQTEQLLRGIDPNRVRMLRGMAHLEAWDVRRQLIRIFGFDGFTLDTIALEQVTEREQQQGGRSRFTVVYRAQVRLTIKAPDGTPLTHFDDAAAGDSVNQPSLGDAHDMAMKTALSQALKRCAVNLGDQFGLSLYSNGSRDAVVKGCLPYMSDVPKDDAPVQPEQQPESAETPQPAAPVAQPQQVPAGPSRDFLAEAQAAADSVAVRDLYDEAAVEGAPAHYLEQLVQIGTAKAELLAA